MKITKRSEKSKNRPVATNFQFLKILATSGLLLVGACGAPNPAGNEYGKLELVGAKPLHLANARPFGRLKAPLGLSLLRFAAQTRSYSAIFFHFLILVLNVPNGATVLTCINLYTSQTAVLVDSSAHFLICGSNNSSSLNESIIS